MGTSNIRMFGMASGLDTESIVSQLMSAERLGANKIKQNLQLTEWRVEAYRGVTTKVNDFAKKYMDILNGSTNMMSMANYKKFTITSKNLDGKESTAFKIKSNNTTLTGEHKIEISSVAKATTITSTGNVMNSIKGINAITDFNMDGKSIAVKLDGSTRSIQLSDYRVMEVDDEGIETETVDKAASMQKMLDDINLKLKSAYGDSLDSGINKVNVTEIQDADGNGTGVIKFDIGRGSNNLSITGNTGNLAIPTNAGVNKLSTSMTLSEASSKFNTPLVFGGSDGIQDKVAFKINGQTFEFDKSDSIDTMMKKINLDTKANVTLNYDSFTDKFTLSTNDKGIGTKIELEDTKGNFLSSILGVGAGTFQNGADTIAKVDGIDIIRSDTSFEVFGMTIEALETTTGPNTIKLEHDTEAVFTLIKDFINDYNTMIGDIDRLVNEKYDRNFLPLTDEQKEAMTTDQISLWETKAKTGLLRRDPILETMLNNLRGTLSQSVEGVGKSLASIGISTGDYKNKGKINLDADAETKLREAIAKDPDSVMNLFAKKSETYSVSSRNYTAAQRAVKNREQGLIYKIYDVLQDNVSTFRDLNNKKGALLEKAGMPGDASEAENLLFKQLERYDIDLANFERRLSMKEESYYKKFSALESAMQKMNNQSAWLSSQIAGLSS